MFGSTCFIYFPSIWFGQEFEQKNENILWNPPLIWEGVEECPRTNAVEYEEDPVTHNHPITGAGTFSVLWNLFSFGAECETLVRGGWLVVAFWPICHRISLPSFCQRDPLLGKWLKLQFRFLHNGWKWHYPVFVLYQSYIRGKYVHTIPNVWSKTCFSLLVFYSNKCVLSNSKMGFGFGEICRCKCVGLFFVQKHVGLWGVVRCTYYK